MLRTALVKPLKSDSAYCNVHLISQLVYPISSDPEDLKVFLALKNTPCISQLLITSLARKGPAHTWFTVKLKYNFNMKTEKSCVLQ